MKERVISTVMSISFNPSISLRIRYAQHRMARGRGEGNKQGEDRPL